MSDYDGVQVCSITAQVNPGEGLCSAWRGRRTDRSVTIIHFVNKNFVHSKGSCSGIEVF